MRDAIVGFFLHTLGITDPMLWIAMAVSWWLGRARQSAVLAFVVAFGLGLLVVLTNWGVWQKLYATEASNMALEVLLISVFLRGPLLLMCWGAGRFTSVPR